MLLKFHMKVALLLSLLGTFFLPLLATQAWAATPFNVEVEGAIATAQKNLVRQQFNQAYSVLPPKMQKALQQNLNLNHFQLRVLPLEAHVAGDINRQGQLSINQNLLDKPQTLTRLIIHELSHVYDKLQLLPPDIKEYAWDCNAWKNQYQETARPDYCELYENSRATVSSLPDFLDISGWYQSLNGKGQRIPETVLSERSPDQYETRSHEEMFAVNMEYFLTDSEYQCRRPSLYRYLSRHFVYEPFSGKSCGANLNVVDSQFMSAQKALRTIDPDRIYAIHYLLASPGSGAASMFGHSMIRLVICAPDRPTVGPECLHDIENHIVVDFRGFVDTPEMSGWAGLTGAYSSRLFFIPFPQIIQEYTLDSLRDLKSYPLDLSREEMKTFLERAVESHWSYKDQYYFITNNCAVEIMNLIKSGLSRANLYNSRTQTPEAVLVELTNKKLIRADVDFKNLSEAKNQGYYFPSYEVGLNQALTVIAKMSGQKYSLNSWLKTSPLERRSLYQMASFDNALSRKKWAAGFLYLERYLQKQVTQDIFDSILANEKNPSSPLGLKAKALTDKIRESLTYKQDLTNPASLSKVGYGIPSQVELQQVQMQIVQMQAQRAKNKTEIDKLTQQIMDLYEGKDLTLIEENKQIFALGLKN